MSEIVVKTEYTAEPAVVPPSGTGFCPVQQVPQSFVQVEKALMVVGVVQAESEKNSNFNPAARSVAQVLVFTPASTR